jgi:hypothetical protein
MQSVAQGGHTKEVLDLLDDGDGEVGVPGVHLVDLGHQLIPVLVMTWPITGNSTTHTRLVSSSVNLPAISLASAKSFSVALSTSVTSPMPRSSNDKIRGYIYRQHGKPAV